MSIDNNEQQVAEPTVRLCVLRTWPQHFDGYGFNLHAEKSKTSAPANGNAGGGLPFSGGQYIGKVDRGSPAESAGLREGDRIVQVDGVDIEGETHPKVVSRIKKGSNSENPSDVSDPDNLISRCSLLVVDRRADTYYKEKGIRVHSNMGLQVLVLNTPEEPTPECLSLQQNTNTSSPKNTSTTTVVNAKQQASLYYLFLKYRFFFKHFMWTFSCFFFLFEKIFFKSRKNSVLVKGWAWVAVLAKDSGALPYDA